MPALQRECGNPLAGILHFPTTDLLQAPLSAGLPRRLHAPGVEKPNLECENSCVYIPSPARIAFYRLLSHTLPHCYYKQGPGRLGTLGTGTCHDYFGSNGCLTLTCSISERAELDLAFHSFT